MKVVFGILLVCHSLGSAFLHVQLQQTILRRNFFSSKSLNTNLFPITSNLVRNCNSIDLDGGVESTSNDISSLNPIFRGIKILQKFSRPHTIKGTILASTMGVSRALIENPGSISLRLVPKAIIGLVALICGNAYIVGLNQIYDVKIDEVYYIHFKFLLCNLLNLFCHGSDQQALSTDCCQVTVASESVATYHHMYSNRSVKFLIINIQLLQYSVTFSFACERIINC